MARIRTIKPEFWQDEKLAPLPAIDRLVYLGLISQADDAGRLVDNPRLLDGLLFPETDETCASSLETLARLSRIRRYTSSSGQRLLQIMNWDKHQRVDRPSAHVLPPPPPEDVPLQLVMEPDESAPDTLATDSRHPIAPTNDHGPRTLDLGPTTMDAAARAHAVREVVMAANQGMVANRTLDQQRLRPIDVSSGDSQQYVNEWLDAGIPPDLIAATVTRIARNYRPGNRSRQIGSMKYFDDAVRDEFTKQELRRGNGNGKGTRHSAGGRNGAIPGKGSSGSHKDRRKQGFG